MANAVSRQSEVLEAKKVVLKLQPTVNCFFHFECEWNTSLNGANGFIAPKAFFDRFIHLSWRVKTWYRHDSLSLQRLLLDIEKSQNWIFFRWFCCFTCSRNHRHSQFALERRELAVADTALSFHASLNFNQRNFYDEMKRNFGWETWTSNLPRSSPLLRVPMRGGWRKLFSGP